MSCIRPSPRHIFMNRTLYFTGSMPNADSVYVNQYVDTIFPSINWQTSNARGRITRFSLESSRVMDQSVL